MDTLSPFAAGFAGSTYSIDVVDTLAADSDGGLLVGERPRGVYNVYRVTAVKVHNVGATEIDRDDSDDGLLTQQPPVFLHAWLKLGTGGDRPSAGELIQVY